jgi:hypothetical protein
MRHICMGTHAKRNGKRGPHLHVLQGVVHSRPVGVCRGVHLLGHDGELAEALHQARRHRAWRGAMGHRP